MAVTADTVQVRLEAQTRNYEQDVRRAERTSTSAFAQIAAGAQRSNAAVAASLRGFAGAFVGVQALQGAVQLTDAATSITNALRVAGLEGQELTNVYDQLFASAQRNAAPLQSLAQLYSRVAIVQDELNVSTEELTNFTDNVAAALRVAGTDAQGASGALLQLSQALGAGTVRAEEFNSIQEGALPVLQAVAAGLEEAGGSVARLRALVLEGRVSSEAFFRAFEAGAPILEERLAGAELTVSQAFVRLQNVLIDAAGQFNNSTNTSRLLTTGLEDLGTVVGDLVGFINAAAGPLNQFVTLLGQAEGAAGGLGNEIAKITGAGQGIGLSLATFLNDRQIPGLTIGNYAGDETINATFSLLGETTQDEALAALLTGQSTGASQAVDTVNATFSLLGETPQDQALAAALLGNTGRSINTVSIEDYAAPGAAGSGKAAARKAEQERQAVLDLIDALEFERSLIGQSARDREIANNIRSAGAAATAEQIERIRELTGATYDAQTAQDALNLSAEQWASTVQEATRGFIDDLLAGKTAAESFGNVLSRVADQLISIGLNSIFGTGGFNLTGLFGGGLSTRATGGPVYPGNPTIINERGQEVFVPSVPGNIVPASQVGGGGSVTFAPVIDARGADAAAVARLERAVQDTASQIIPAIRREMATAGKKGRTRG